MKKDLRVLPGLLEFVVRRASAEKTNLGNNMLKKINRVLKLVGLNLVRAKRKSVKWQKVPPHAVMTAPVNFKVDQPGAAQEWQTLERYTPEDKVPLADYMGDSEWHNAPGPTGNVGCLGEVGPLGPPDGEGVRGPSGPVGEDSHEMTRVEQPNSDNKIGAPTS